MIWLLLGILIETMVCALTLIIILLALRTIRQLLADILRELRNK